MASTAPQVAPAVRAMQLKELQRRLQSVSYAVWSRAADKALLPEPAAIRQQRLAVERFVGANHRRSQKAKAAAQKRLDAARSQILFGDVGKALKMIEALEAEVGEA